MRTHHGDVLRAVIVVVALAGALVYGNPAAWATLVTALYWLLRG